MKKNNLVIFVCILIATIFSVKAQEELDLPEVYSVLHMNDSIPVSEYDTMVIFNPDIYEYGCLFNYQYSNWNTFTDPLPNVIYYNNWQEQTNPLQFDTDGNIINEPNLVSNGYFSPLLSANGYGAEGFAQPYHLDYPVKIIGVAARVWGDLTPDALKYSFHLLDEDFNELQKSIGMWWDADEDDLRPLRLYAFLSDNYPEGQNYIEVKDFYISADENYQSTTPNLAYSRTLSIFDTIWQDTIIGCQAEYTPYLKKNGEWRSFADDSVYQFYQKVFIEFLPVILAPRNTESSLNDDITNENLWLYPNP
ncbi:MAG: hypothetical protein IJ213_00675, partial [Bacteroidales bacterium]|nr:hypothetical protein [Bacteroidales bacterium]